MLVCALPAAALAGGQGDPLRDRQWNLDLIRIDPARATATGSGAVVAVVDTGVQAGHPDLSGQVLEGKDFVDSGPPDDENGHGTHVAGIVAAKTGNGEGVASVAPGSKVLPVRVLDDEGGGSSSDVADGIDYAVDAGASVITLSLSAEIPLPALGFGGAISDSIRRALDRGVVVVMAAGNTGLPLCEQDTIEGRILCVGAVDRNGSRASYSSHGSGLSLVAPGGSGFDEPGENVLSTYRSSSYEEIAGTSMAAPHVAGVAAMLVELGLRGQEATARILATARDAGPPGRDGAYGAGILDAQAAVAGLSRPSDATPPPAPTPPAARASARVPRAASIRSVLRSGLAVRCRGTRDGRCTATMTRRRRVLARGSRRAGASALTVRVRPTRSGRRVLRSALRRRSRFTVLVTVRPPGGAAVRRRVRLR